MVRQYALPVDLKEPYLTPRKTREMKALSFIVAVLRCFERTNFELKEVEGIGSSLFDSLERESGSTGRFLYPKITW